MRRPRGWKIGVALVVCGGVGVFSAPAGAQPVARPFTVAFHQTLTDFTCSTPTACVATATGYGQANQLGKVTEAVSVTFDFSTSPCSAIPIFTNTVRVASGDELFLVGSGEVCPSGSSAKSSAVRFTWTVVGGTGMFAGASGSGIGWREFNPTPNPTEINHYKGTLTY
jgi:hypothetical protein